MTPEERRAKLDESCPGCGANLHRHDGAGTGHEIWKYRCGTHVVWLVEWHYSPSVKCLLKQIRRLTAENKRLREACPLLLETTK